MYDALAGIDTMPAWWALRCSHHMQKAYLAFSVRASLQPALVRYNFPLPWNRSIRSIFKLAISSSPSDRLLKQPSATHTTSPALHAY